MPHHPAAVRRQPRCEPSLAIEAGQHRLHIRDHGLDLDDQERPTCRMPAEHVDRAALAEAVEGDLGQRLPATFRERLKHDLDHPSVRRIEQSIQPLALPQQPHRHPRPDRLGDASKRVTGQPVGIAALGTGYRRLRHAGTPPELGLGPPPPTTERPDAETHAHGVHSGSLTGIAYARLNYDRNVTRQDHDPIAAAQAAPDLATLGTAIAACRACPRLVEWREEQARVKVKRFRDEPYWGRPVPGYGDPAARILLVGLAPAAHGGNRTGRVFTGDASGDFLWRAMHTVGLADRAESRRGDDGLVLHGARVAAAVRCAPPANRPSTTEQTTCRPFLVREIELLDDLRVVLALGGLAWDASLRSLAALGQPVPTPKPRFGHTAEASIGPITLLGSYHPSQQNTFTGRLTPPMLERVLARAIELSHQP
jgi:uracil-DNA glycosylase family 4